MAWTQKEIDAVYEGVMKRSATDAVFRKKLLADPPKAIAEFSGKELPAGFRVKIVESDPAYQATFVVPDLVSEEMDEEGLRKVAGGVSAALIASLVAGVCAVAVGVDYCAGDVCGYVFNVK